MSTKIKLINQIRLGNTDLYLPDVLFDFTREVSSLFSNQKAGILIYGSSVTNIKSDLDLCIIVSEYNQSQRERVANLVVNLHKKYNLILDWDVPYEQKTIYSFKELDRALSGYPFSIQNGNFYISPIMKHPEFLASDLIKDRLIINALTTKSLAYYGSLGKIYHYKNKAWHSLIRFVFSHLKNQPLTEVEFIKSIGTDPVSGKKYKEFLGYNIADEEINKYLLHRFRIISTKLVQKGLMQNKSGKYYCNKDWIEELINLSKNYV